MLLADGQVRTRTEVVVFVVKSHLKVEGRRKTLLEAEALRHFLAEQRSAYLSKAGYHFTLAAWEIGLSDLELYPIEVPA